MTPSWASGWEPGELADRLLLVGEDTALSWAETEEQVWYCAKVLGWTDAQVRQILRQRIWWRNRFGKHTK